jgi:hypothetical protein
VLLFGKELPSFEPLNEVFGVGNGRWPVKPRSVRFADQIGGCRMATTLATMDLS